VRGGRFKIVNCRFFNNACASAGPDVGGAAIRVFSQYNNLPVYVVNSTFDGAEGYGNFGSNGGGISSIAFHGLLSIVFFLKTGLLAMVETRPSRNYRWR